MEWLAGVLESMLQIPKRNCMCARGLVRLLGPTEKVLQEYKARAVASGQTFERVVRLEAAVLGWSSPHSPLSPRTGRGSLMSAIQ